MYDQWLYLFPERGNNEKLGLIPATTAPEQTCPTSCPLKNNGCYAKQGPISWWWRRVSQGTHGISWRDLLERIANLPKRQPWRWGQAGDLPGDGARIYPDALRAIVKANAHRPGWAYTHYDPADPVNAAAIADANTNGFVVNLSADTLAEADEFKALDIGPVVVVLPHDAPPILDTPAGNRVIVCPEQTGALATCGHCLLCAKPRQAIVGFRAHGVKHKAAEKVALNLS